MSYILYKTCSLPLLLGGDGAVGGAPRKTAAARAAGDQGVLTGWGRPAAQGVLAS